MAAKAVPTEPDIRENSRLYPHWSDSRYYGLIRLRVAMTDVISVYLSNFADRKQVTAVDFGCGTTPYKALFASYVDRYMAADLPGNQVADIFIDPATGRVPLPGQSVDVVISNQVLEHVEQPEQYLREAFRLCRPGGLLILSTHGFWMYHPDPQDYWRWTGAGLRRLLQEYGWEVLELKGIIGFAATSLCLLQDALSWKIPRILRPVFTICMQQLIRLLDAFYSPESRKENACLYLVVAKRPET